MRSAALAQPERGALLVRAALWGTFALGLIVWFGNIGFRILAEPDEARYAEIAREMLVTGDWVTPHLNGIPYLEKPPLQYWATAALYSVFGMTPWVARLWSSGLGLLGLVITYLTARSLWGERAAGCAALIMASFPLYFVIAHLNILDAGIAFFMNGAVCAFLMAQRAPHSSSRRRHWMYLCWTATALGFLQKGLVALVLPGLALAVYSVLYRDRRIWRGLHLLDGSIILLAIAGPWVVLAAQRNPGFLKFFFIHEHFARYATTVHKRFEPWWYFIAIALVGVLPWIVPMIRAVWNTMRQRAAHSHTLASERLLLVWAMTQLLFFSLSDSKLAPYIVPMAMPLAMLTARWLDAHGTLRSLRAVALPSLGMTLLLVSLPWLVPHFELAASKRASYLEVAQWGRLAGMVGFGCLIAYLLCARLGKMRAAVAALAASMAAPLAIAMSGSNALEPLRGSSMMAHAVAPYLMSDTPLFCVGMYSQRLPFVLNRTCTLVQYSGELELQFDPHRRNHLPTLAEFADRWRNEPDAVAVVKPVLWPYILDSGIPQRVVMRDDTVIVMVKP